MASKRMFAVRDLNNGCVLQNHMTKRLMSELLEL
jgi:hypothetical protein